MIEIVQSIDPDFYKQIGLSRIINHESLLDLAKSAKAAKCTPYLEKKSFRLTESWRSFCVPLKNNFLLIIKGSEIELDDLSETYKTYFQKYQQLGSPSNAEHFFYKENKIPLLHLLEEGTEEFSKSQALLSDYFNTFKTIPKLPIPIANFKYDISKIKNKDVEKFISILESDFGIDIRKRMFSKYVYLYQGHPSRLKSWKQSVENRNLNWHSWQNQQARFFNAEELISDYIKLFVQISSLGWILSPLGKDHMGYPISLQNLTTDGGFVDINNLVRISKPLSRQHEVSFLNSIILLIDALKEIAYPSRRVSTQLGSALFSVKACRLIEAEFSKIKKEGELKRVYLNYFGSRSKLIPDPLKKLLENDITENLETVV